MQLSELLYQRVRGLGGQGQLALKPGYVVVVSTSAALRPALVAAIFPGLEDEKQLSDGSGGVTRVGVGVVPAASPPCRVLRELGGDRQLQRLDPTTKKFQTISKDALEIESFLRLECALPAPELYGSFFVLTAQELPSAKARPAAEGANVDQKKVATLRAELEATKRYEEQQDELFKVSDRLLSLDQLDEKVAAVEVELADLNAVRGKTSYTPAQQADILARANRLKEEEKKRDELLSKIGVERNQLLDRQQQDPEPFQRSTLFSGGIAAGVLIDAVAVLLKRPSIALLGLLGFGAALVAVLRWIEADESGSRVEEELEELAGREDRVKKEFSEQQAPVRAAMKSAGAESPEELAAHFNEKAAVDTTRQAVAARLDKLKADPLYGALGERPKLTEEKQQLELAISTQGFARPLQTIENELKAALGLTAVAEKKPAASDADVPKGLFAQAAQILSAPVESLAAPIEPRLAAYLTALTDKRIVAGRMDANGHLLLSTPDGRWGPYAGLPPPLRDLAYVALRLALLEKVAASKKAPILVDDAFGTFEPPRRALISRMLKGISASGQVIHRVVEPPPAGITEHVVKLP